MTKPWLDVTEVILSPEFMDAFTVIRRQETISNKGRSVVTLTPISVKGVITTPGPNALFREPEQQTMGHAILVVTKFRLRGPSKSGGQSFQPDIVLFNGNHYVVTHLNEYSRYGAGFVEAQCEETDFIEQAAT